MSNKQRDSMNEAQKKYIAKREREKRGLGLKDMYQEGGDAAISFHYGRERLDDGRDIPYIEVKCSFKHPFSNLPGGKNRYYGLGTEEAYDSRYEKPFVTFLLRYSQEGKTPVWGFDALAPHLFKSKATGNQFQGYDFLGNDQLRLLYLATESLAWGNLNPLILDGLHNAAATGDTQFLDQLGRAIKAFHANKAAQECGVETVGVTVAKMVAHVANKRQKVPRAREVFDIYTGRIDPNDIPEAYAQFEKTSLKEEGNFYKALKHAGFSWLMDKAK